MKSEKLLLLLHFPAYCKLPSSYILNTITYHPLAYNSQYGPTYHISNTLSTAPPTYIQLTHPVTHYPSHFTYTIILLLSFIRALTPLELCKHGSSAQRRLYRLYTFNALIISYHFLLVFIEMSLFFIDFH